MPYKKKYTKKPYKKRKKSYRTRFKDDKINTKIEKKIKEISVAEDTKNRQLLVRMVPWGNELLQRQSSSYGFFSLSTNSAADSSYTGLNWSNETAIAGNYYNSIYPEGDASSPGDANRTKMNFRLTKFQAFLQFINPDLVHPCTIRVSLIEVPNSNDYTAAAAPSSDISTILRPNKYIAGVQDLRCKGIFATSYRNQTDFSGFKHTVLKSKQFTLAPKSASSGKNDIDTSARLSWYDLNWSIPFKGKGRRYHYAAADYDPEAELPMTDKNLYFCIAHNAVNEEGRVPPEVRGATGVQYYVEDHISISVRTT